MSTSTLSFGFRRGRPINRGAAYVDVRRHRSNNITLMYAHVFLFTIYQSICQWNLFDAYLSLLASANGFVNVNTWVGFAEGIMGITTLVLALPLGFIVDAYDRIMLLKVAGSIGLVASAISAYALSNDHLIALYTNLCLWGLFIGLQATAAEAVFADSTDKGMRSEQFTTKGVLNTAGLSLGPFLMIILFVVVGDDWELRQLHVPLIIGCCFGPLCCIPLYFMKDPIPKNNAEVVAAGGTFQSSFQNPFLSTPRRTPLVGPASPMLKRDRIGSHCSDYSENMSSLPERTTEGSELSSAGTTPTVSNSEDERFKNFTRRQRCIPFVLTVADFVTEIGAGMTVRFFPLFFIADYHVSPIRLCMIFCLYPLCVAMGMPICYRLSQSIGRAQASFLFQTLGIGALVLMACLDSLPFLIVVFMLRGSLQNSAYPVDRSILTDYTPSKHRGKWNSIASLTTMTWSGSAVIGGYLVDRHDYRFTFLITAGIYAVGVLCYMPLLWWVPRKECPSFIKETKCGSPRMSRGSMAKLDESPIENMQLTGGDSITAMKEQ